MQPKWQLMQMKDTACEEDKESARPQMDTLHKNFDARSNYKLPLLT